MKTIASKYFDSSDMYDKSAMLLDILLVGKFGNKKINTLMKDFTNNMGVVTSQEQLELLADVVAAYYKDMWDKRYEAITVSYNMLEPYKLTSENKSKETSTDSKTSTNNENSVSNIEGGTSTSYDVTDTETKDLTDIKSGSVVTNEDSETTETKSIDHNEGGTDTVTTDYGTNGLEDKKTISGDKTKEIEGKIITSDDTVSEDGEGNPLDNKVTTKIENNPLEEGQTEARGTEHIVTGDKTEEQRLNKEAVTPYAPIEERYVSSSEAPKDENSTEHNLEMERTVDYSTQENTVDTEYHTKKETEYDGYKETEGYEAYAETNTKKGKVTETTEKDDNFDETQNNNKVSNDSSTQLHNTTEGHSGTDTNKKTGSESTDSNSSEVSSKNSLGSEESEGSKDSESSTIEHGNRWGFTNQELVEKELKLRLMNFYDSILRDVASLLTLSVYGKEDV